MTGEFEVIAAINARLPRPPDSDQVWIGDDAAVLPIPGGSSLLFAVDTAVAGVHADLDLTGLDDFGWKALVSSISDMAAMGGRPTHAVVSVAGPPGTDVARIYDGLIEASETYQCPIVGGDMTNADQLVVTVAVIGECDGRPVLRSGARPGNAIWVTRPLGGAAAGLRQLKSSAAQIDPQLRQAHARPRADVAEGTAARHAGATAMIDVSDGLAADLGHVADMSGVGFRLEEVPVTKGAELADAVGGGEDFALVFCAPPDAPVEEAFTGLTGPIRVGECTGDPEERTLAGRPLEITGWEHRW